MPDYLVIMLVVTGYLLGRVKHVIYLDLTLPLYACHIDLYKEGYQDLKRMFDWNFGVGALLL